MGNVYKERPWLKLYPSDVPADVEVPVRSVSEAFDGATEKWKKYTAIVFLGKKISYGELREKVDRFATALSQLGVKKGDRVAVLLVNSPEYVIAFYGAIKIGAVLAPISPVYVSVEIRQQLEDSGAETIVCQDILYDGVKKTGVKLKNVILVNISESKGMATPSADIYKEGGFYSFKDLLKKYPPNPPKVELNAKEDILSINYTGGTSGIPKGVIVSHYNAMCVDALFSAEYPILEDGKEVLVAYVPFHYAGGQTVALLRPLIRGYTIVILTNPDIDNIISAIVDYNVSYLFAAPSLYSRLKDYDEAAKVKWKRVKLLQTAADTLHQNVFKDWNDRTGTVIHDFYGQTECQGITFTPFGRPKSGSVGIPIPSSVVAVVDNKDEFLPAGEIGELVVDSPLTTLGYWKNPEATRANYLLKDGVRWWRTGDLGSMDKEGYFYIYDRTCDVIRIGGLSVYARDVEEVLSSHPQINAAGVVGVSDNKGGQIIKAFVVLESDARGRVSEAEIITYCQDKLAPHKIPQIVAFRGELPMTDNNKVSRRDLREEEA